MSTNVTLPPEVQQLAGLYQSAVQEYEKRAARWKWRYHVAWGMAAGPTWLVLLLGIAGLRWPGLWGYDRPILQWALPVLSLLVTLATLAQLLGQFRLRWLSARAAIERLWMLCMRYRVKAPPFDGPDATEVFRQEIDWARRAADKHEGRRFADQFSWRYYWDLLILPAELKRPLSHTPNEGTWPRNGDVGELGEALVIQGRLQCQRQWHLNKARTFLWRYLAFQVLILLLSGIDASCIYFHGLRLFEVFAFTTAANLMLMAWRDFLGHQALLLLYVKVAGNLGDIQTAYFEQQVPFTANHAPQRLLTLVDEVEATLNDQFQHWYASRR
jgi:hypothetical protein